ncbi:hypothetical protein Vretimale_9992 [Volvox reticuliferus]|uniref:Fungal lipase-type domain-containing protein n=1 Tax=Volvox reticuliferus TaxID=1737510 RepID=A0A8J4LQW1_9CHLO|nr:hypothetical protein Vretifemale_18852 [Volvox reticuliferus]GIM05530.1 hypothetical protein Vretimale_9992 [Volvox reticuliferus]
MGLHQPVLKALVVAGVALLAMSAHARQLEQLKGFWYESLSAPQRSARSPLLLAEPGGASKEGHEEVPAVFRNGAWNPEHSTNLNAYVSAMLSKDVYFKHVIDPRDGRAARRNFTLFAQLFCRAMVRLGADDCEVVSGADSLVWAVVRAGPSVLLVIRGSNTPQNWLADVTSFRMTNVADFGGGPGGTNVAVGFYKVFAANRRAIVDRVRAAMDKATAAAAPSETTAGKDTAAIGGGGGGGQVITAIGSGSDNAYGNGLYGSSRARLWVFGHSLGGAVALMAASYMDAREGITATGVYTYGCPRVGDESWAQSYELHDATLRLENTGDIIPMLPLGSAWRHVGASVTIQPCKNLKGLPLELVADDDVLASTTMPGGKASVSASAVEPLSDGGVAAAEGTVAVVKLQGGATGGGPTGRRLSAGHQRQLCSGGGSDSDSDSDSGGGGGGGGKNGDSGNGSDGSDGSDSGNGSDGSGRWQDEAHHVTEEMAADGEVTAAHTAMATVVQAEMAEEEGNLDGTGVSFPFPVSFRDHWIQTYVQVMWSCLPTQDQGLVPGPEDVYDKL